MYVAIHWKGRKVWQKRRFADYVPMSSFQMSGCAAMKAAISSTQTRESRVISSTPRFP